MEENVYICSSSAAERFDAIEGWKTNELKYRILSKMANDILSIPITSVASESAFSAGGRVIDPYRASLKPETMQVLLCGSDWARHSRGMKKVSKVNAISHLLHFYIFLIREFILMIMIPLFLFFFNSRKN